MKNDVEKKVSYKMLSKQYIFQYLAEVVTVQYFPNGLTDRF